MNCFDVTRILNSQGADKNHMGAVLENLHKNDLLPTWGPGSTGAELAPQHIVNIILGASAPNPAQAAQHVGTAAQLQAGDGYTLENVLLKIILSEPCRIQVEEISIAATGATIRYADGTVTLLGEGKAFQHTCIIRGSLLGMIALKMQRPTTSGFTTRCDNSGAGIEPA